LLGALIAIAALTFVAQGTATPAQALTNCYVANTTFDETEQAFLDIINQYRVSNGLQPLTVSLNLNRTASWMAQDLAAKNYFSHTDSAGRDPFTRNFDCGGPYDSGENLAAGTRIDTAQAAFRLWRSSSGHNKNMLTAAYTQIGIARAYNPGSRYTWYWATEFGIPDDGTRMSNNVTLLNPQPMSGLSGVTATFEWSSSSLAEQFRLDIGTTTGGADIYSGDPSLSQRVTVTNLPYQSSDVYVRLWARVAGTWQYTDYVYPRTALYG
jgi:uncharacterized protein YkwD